MACTPWPIIRPGADQWHPKALTLGKPALMGRRTEESAGRALPGRLLTRSGQTPLEGMDAVKSLGAAVACAAAVGAGKLVAIGGGEVYALALPFATAMHLTHVETAVDGADAFFPHVDARAWREIARSHRPADAAHAFAFDFVDYRRA